MSSVKFWRPGAAAPGADAADLNAEGGEASTAVTAIYNPRSSLPLAKQRALLPAARRKGEILQALEEHRCVIVKGETGSGKTTQVPQFLYEGGWCQGDRAVLVTEPRRIAALSAAERVAAERGCRVGEHVGYSVRFEHQFTTATSIVYTTEGTLLRMMMSDPLLSRYSVVMVDEAHERSVTCDLLLGLLRKIQRRRGNLRLIVSSATVQTDDFISFLGADETAVVSIEGKMYPVEISYARAPVPSFIDEAFRVVEDIHKRNKVDSGAVLVFVPSAEECEDLFVRISQSLGRNVHAVPLYASLPAKMQLAALEAAPVGRRKVVVATNVAETSITIDDVAYVVDSLFAKVNCYSYEDHVASLALVPISQASAKQRAGRAGRTRPGQCFRLCTAVDFARLSPSTPPEIQRADLLAAVLQLKAFGIDDLMSFHFPTPPAPDVVADALTRLYDLGAIDGDGRLTDEIGARMAELPVDPELARCLLASETYLCTKEMCAIAGMLQSSTLLISASATRERRQYEAVREPYSVAEGDLLTYLNMYNAYEANNASASWCSKKGFNPKGFKQAKRISSNLQKFFRTHNHTGKTKERLDVRLRKAACAGLFLRAASVNADGTYALILSTKHSCRRPLRMHPTSVLFDRYPRCVVFVESVQTSLLYMRHITVVDPYWLPEIASQRFEERRKRAMAEWQKNLGEYQRDAKVGRKQL